MSEKRLSLFPKNIQYEFPSEDKLTAVLLSADVIQNDPERTGFFILSPGFTSLLDQSESSLRHPEQICVWFEYFDAPGIQIGSNSQDIELVKAPNDDRILGDLDVAYSLLGELSEDIEARYTDPLTGKTYNIRDLDFSNHIGYGRSYIHVDRYMKPTPEFIEKLEQIIHLKLGWSLFWL
ncbi:MAG: hypothetical protein EP338_06645 [Bacteroidetes bacterium]|nr:MAG: hypothetical protein EP338_06645 [Bacteroidota bacterium]